MVENTICLDNALFDNNCILIYKIYKGTLEKMLWSKQKDRNIFYIVLVGKREFYNI